jgi:hypothetical protein
VWRASNRVGARGRGEETLENLCVCIYYEVLRVHMSDIWSGYADMWVRILPTNKYPSGLESCPHPRPWADSDTRIRTQRVFLPVGISCLSPSLVAAPATGDRRCLLPMGGAH